MGSGKSTLLWQAVKHFEGGPQTERSASTQIAMPKRSTSGLVRWVLRIPNASGALATVQLCDGGGSPGARRLWVDLVRNADGAPRPLPLHALTATVSVIIAVVRGLIFVADIDDASEDTIFLFKQLGLA